MAACGLQQNRTSSGPSHCRACSLPPPMVQIGMFSARSQVVKVQCHQQDSKGVHSPAQLLLYAQRVALNGLIHAPSLPQGIAQVIVGLWEVGLMRQRLPICRNGTVQLPLLEEDSCRDAICSLAAGMTGNKEREGAHTQRAGYAQNTTAVPCDVCELATPICRQSPFLRSALNWPC